jgi:hypothetical protein
MKKVFCELCFERQILSVHHTICQVCDDRMRITQETQAAVRAERWALTHRCRKCKVGLPEDRYFECYGCDSPLTRESADEFDGCDDLNWVEEGRTHNAAVIDKKMKLAVAKHCKTCGVLKQPEEFTRHPGMADGVLNHCKLCKNKAEAGKRRAARQKIMEAKGAA